MVSNEGLQLAEDGTINESLAPIRRCGRAVNKLSTLQSALNFIDSRENPSQQFS